MRIRIELGDAVAEATLLTDEAPRTTSSLWDALPLADRAIQVRWCGSAWRTERNHELLTPDAPVENIADRLAAGDIVYYPGYAAGLLKLGFAYGPARWAEVYHEPVSVSLIGRVDSNLGQFVSESERVFLAGPADVQLSRTS